MSTEPQGPVPAESGPMRSPGFWLYHASLTWRARLSAALEPFDLTPTQFLVLASTGWLHSTTGPPSQQDVAQAAGVDRMMTSRVLRGLADRGLLERQHDVDDARGRRVVLTRTGRHLAEKAVHAAQQVDRELFGLDNQLRDQLRTIAELR